MRQIDILAKQIEDLINDCDLSTEYGKGMSDAYNTINKTIEKIKSERLNLSTEEIYDELDDLITQFSQLANKIVNVGYPSLMKRPDDLERFRTVTCFGKDLHTKDTYDRDPTYWKYPEGVEENVKDYSLYKVWYSHRDAADPEDFTSWNYVKYIKQISSSRENILNKISKIFTLLS